MVVATWLGPRARRRGPRSTWCGRDGVDGADFGDMEMDGDRDEYDMWVHLVSETMDIPGQDFLFPDVPNSYRVHFRPGLLSSGYKRQGFRLQGSNRPTSPALAKFGSSATSRASHHHYHRLDSTRANFQICYSLAHTSRSIYSTLEISTRCI